MYNDDPTQGQDPSAYGGGGEPTDPYGTPLSQNRRAAIAGFYQNALGRAASPGELDQWANGGMDIGAIQTAIYGSPEAQTYSSRQQAPAPTANTDQTPTPPSGPGPQAAPTQAAPSSPAPSGGQAPSFTPPSYSKPEPFSYGSFVAPDPNKLDEDPLYRDTLHREQDAIQRSAAARGILNTGGTIDDLLRNSKDIAATGYANLFNRDLSTYQTNRTNALDTYNTNYGTQFQDPYKYNYMGAQDAYNSNQHNYDLSKQYGWYQNLFDFQKQQDARNFDYTKSQDLFNNKYKLLSF